MNWEFTEHFSLPSEEIQSYLDKYCFFNKKVFLITSQQNGVGTIQGYALNKVRAKQKCFTRNKKERKFFYTELKRTLVVSEQILEEMNITTYLMKLKTKLNQESLDKNHI